MVGDGISEASTVSHVCEEAHPTLFNLDLDQIFEHHHVIFMDPGSIQVEKIDVFLSLEIELQIIGDFRVFFLNVHIFVCRLPTASNQSVSMI